MMKVVFSPCIESRFAQHENRIESNTRHLQIEVHTIGQEDNQKRFEAIENLIKERPAVSTTPNCGKQFMFLQNSIRNPQFFGRQECMDELDSYFSGWSTAKDPAQSAASQTRSQDGSKNGNADISSAADPRHTTGSSHKVQSVVIHGLGGCGKSSVAKEYMFRRLDDYAVVLWLYADVREKLETQFINLSRKLGMQATESDAREAVLDWVNHLGMHHGRVFNENTD
jgi:hypothetical protein